MLPLLFCICVFPAVLRADKIPGMSQFMADDYKVFDQMYGRTSDKELYGMSLPPSMTYNFDIAKQLQLQSDMKERYMTKEKLLDLQLYNDKNTKLFSNYLDSKTAKPALQFISLSDLKPISESNDPDTYNYLKHLEQMDKLKHSIQKITKIKETEAEAEAAYKSIQDILDAHEANKKDSIDSNEDSPKKKKANNGENSRNNRGRNGNKVRQINGNGLKPRNVSRFRKSPKALRMHSRPYIRKIRYHYTD